MQIVFAGKAHPSDEGGKQLLASMIEFAAEYDVEDRVVSSPTSTTPSTAPWPKESTSG